MNITITDQILSGNLGDGWNNQNEAAEALAEYQETIWENDLSELVTEGRDITINISTQKNTSGYCRDLEIYVEIDNDDDFNISLEIEKRVEGMLTDSNEIWQSFCCDEKFGYLMVDVI